MRVAPTKVPLVDARSSTQKPPPGACEMRAWCRLTPTSSTTRSASSARPMVTAVPSMAMSCPACGPVSTVSVAHASPVAGQGRVEGRRVVVPRGRMSRTGGVGPDRVSGRRPIDHARDVERRVRIEGCLARSVVMSRIRALRTTRYARSVPHGGRPALWSRELGERRVSRPADGHQEVVGAEGLVEHSDGAEPPGDRVESNRPRGRSRRRRAGSSERHEGLRGRRAPRAWAS